MKHTVYLFLTLILLNNMMVDAAPLLKCVQFYDNRNTQIGIPSHAKFEHFLSLLDQPIEPNNAFFRLPKEDTDFPSFPRKKAVSSVQVKSEDNDGAGFFILSRVANTWKSSLGPNTFAPESDPTWVLSALGPKVASFLGFRMLDDDTFIVPNAVLFNQRIEYMNIRLVRNGFEPISVRWAEKIPLSKNPDDTIRTYSESYLRAAVLKMTSPFQTKEITHDTAHHALDVLLTDKLRGPQQMRDTIAIEFSDFVRDYTSTYPRRFPLLSISSNREAVLALFFQTLANNHDGFSGRIPLQVLLELAPGNFENFRVYDSHLGREFSPTEALARIVFENKRDRTLKSWFETRMEKYVAVSNMLLLKAHREYTLQDWLEHAVFGRLQEQLNPNFILGPGESKSILRGYTENKFGENIAEVGRQYGSYNSEMRALYRVFTKSNEKVKTILVSYDDDFNVKSGLAPADSYHSLLKARAAELEKALSN
ncbi:MAG: hypothetical protein JNL11_19505 [Bdellovibrionaceae bacterium]|nr:hypothetical protein [Pseudobdellovibrionaceae bacterium]